MFDKILIANRGEIVDICVHDGDLVEYGCCLMKIY